MHQPLALIISPDRGFSQQLCWLLTSDEEMMAVRSETDSHAAGLAGELRIDVILLDVDRAPREVVRLLSDLQRLGVSAPALWMSERYANVDLEKAKQAGARGVIEKHGDPEMIRQAVRSIIGNRPFFPPENTCPATPGAKSLVESERLMRALKAVEGEP